MTTAATLPADPSQPTAERSVSWDRIREELLDPRTRLRPWRIDEYHRMIEAGILQEGEPYELLGGQVILKDRSAAGEDAMTVGNHHIWVVQGLAELNSQLMPLGCHLRLQQPLSLAPLDEPEPDGAIVEGDKDAYRNSKPTVKHLRCLIEVADSSLQRDRQSKLPAYAAAGVPCYLIVNLPDERIEVYTEAVVEEERYDTTHTARRGQSVSLPTPGGGLEIAVDQLLP